MRLWSDHGDLRKESRIAATARSVATSRRTKVALTTIGLLAGAAALASTGLTGSGPVAKRDCSLARYAWLPECSTQAKAKPEATRPDVAARAKPVTSDPVEKTAAVEKPAAEKQVVAEKQAEPAIPAPALPPERPVLADSTASESDKPAQAAQTDAKAENPRIAVSPPAAPGIATERTEEAVASEPKRTPTRRKARAKRTPPAEAASADTRTGTAPRYAEFRDPLTGRVYRDSRMRDSGW